ncbi:hypothetical protein LTR36_000647 [Oleoguttula mirabilis]|uniref:C2H2-type domain-containing protein n=1 Tax=Oleoguttula mirabilis TaxID=1507867 RepID=A0AAV9JQC0_9PEZI|nr:hypothetical protein LTR36_000647 [Oleoguttula mirabilis]
MNIRRATIENMIENELYAVVPSFVCKGCHASFSTVEAVREHVHTNVPCMTDPSVDVDLTEYHADSAPGGPVRPERQAAQGTVTQQQDTGPVRVGAPGFGAPGTIPSGRLQGLGTQPKPPTWAERARSSMPNKDEKAGSKAAD